MPDPQAIVMETITNLLSQRDEGDTAVTLQSKLADDLQLDSLELAELSAVLEDAFGTDPYSEGETPHTVQDVVSFFAG